MPRADAHAREAIGRPHHGYAIELTVASITIMASYIAKSEHTTRTWQSRTAAVDAAAPNYRAEHSRAQSDTFSRSDSKVYFLDDGIVARNTCARRYSLHYAVNCIDWAKKRALLNDAAFSSASKFS